MSKTKTKPAPAPAPPPAPPTPVAIPDGGRIILFGLRGAGKTSLLASLGLIAGKRKDDLGGTLFDTSGRLGELAAAASVLPRLSQTDDEIVAYPIRHDPLDGPPRDAVLLDCSGDAARQVIENRAVLGEAPEGTLAREVAEADALLLLADAAASGEKLDESFAAFGSFLQSLRELRGERTEVGGMPVYLVLNRCDALADERDTYSDWVEKIHRRKNEVGERFKDFLAESAEADPAFGELDFDVVATATRRPKIRGDAGEDLYGVASLFRQCLEAAADYDDSRRRSQGRLLRLFGASLSLLVVLTILAGVVFAFHRDPPTRVLERRVEDLRAADTGVADRLTGTEEDLKALKVELEKLKQEEAFGLLPEALRGYVEARLTELAKYLAYQDKLLGQKPSLFAISSAVGLDSFTRQLSPGGTLALPEEEWKATPAGRLHAKRLAAAAALLRAVGAVADWYRGESDGVNAAWSFAGYVRADSGIEWHRWTGRAEQLLDPARRPPFRELQVIPDAPDESLPYGVAYRYNEVIDARLSWERDREGLKKLLDLTTAVGLAKPGKNRPAVLVFPAKPSLALVRQRLAELRSAYPDYDRHFTRDAVPESLVLELSQAARQQYGLLLEPARAEVLRQLQIAGRGPKETPERWDAVRAWLARPVELAQWRELSRLLLRLSDPAAEDPTAALASFLARPRLAIDGDLRAVALEIPQVRGLAPREGAKFVFTHTRDGKVVPTPTFDPSGPQAIDRERGTATYTFSRADRQVIEFRPGDTFSASVVLKGGKEQLTWNTARSSLYAVESLRRPPRLQDVGGAAGSGRVLEDVRLAFRRDDSVPTVPDLLPEVSLVE